MALKIRGIPTSAADPLKRDMRYRMAMSRKAFGNSRHVWFTANFTSPESDGYSELRTAKSVRDGRGTLISSESSEMNTTCYSRNAVQRNRFREYS
jgi:hypothetical protein